MLRVALNTTFTAHATDRRRVSLPGMSPIASPSGSNQDHRTHERIPGGSATHRFRDANACGGSIGTLIARSGTHGSG